MHNKHWLTSTRFSPFSAPWTNSVPKEICIQVLASISRLSPSTRTNCSVTFDPRKGKAVEGRDDLIT